jgi:trehalose synthase
MLPKVSVGLHCCASSSNIENYRPLVGDAIIDEILALSRSLRGVRICNITATASGGGVAELLSRQIPVYQSLGVAADWRIIHGDKDFFTITKGFHNALQGAKFELTPVVIREYLDHNRLSAEALEGEYDVYVVHDQPAALRHFVKHNSQKWIWRCHIDTSGTESGGLGVLAPLHRNPRCGCVYDEAVRSAGFGDRAALLHPDGHRSALNQEHGLAARSVSTSDCRLGRQPA